MSVLLLTYQQPALPLECYAWTQVKAGVPRVGVLIPEDVAVPVTVYVDTWDNRRHIIVRTTLHGARALVDYIITVMAAARVLARGH